MDKRRFEQLWSRCTDSCGDMGGLFVEVARSYGEGHRRYHTPEHVEHCLDQFDAARPLMDDPDSVELALWYHDIIYDVVRRDNEARSADLFEQRAREGMSAERVRTVRDLIMVTVHSRVLPASADEGYMVDIDLSSFGLPWERFLVDSVAVRDEFGHLSDEEFYARQRNFLVALLEREHFCCTSFFRARHEDQARKNIARYLEVMASKGLI